MTTTETRKTAKLPPIGELSALVRHVKKCISPEYRADEFDEMPGICLTIGWSAESGEWSYQTGDNSYAGGAYHYPHWAVVSVYRRSNSRNLALDIRSQLAEFRIMQAARGPILGLCE